MTITARSAVRQWFWSRKLDQVGGLSPQKTANAVVQYLVHALAQLLLLEEEDWPVVRQHPWTSTRGRVRVRRSAEDGARDARNRCHRHACDDGPRLPVDNIGICTQKKKKRFDEKWQEGKKGRKTVLARKPWMDARRADVFACHDWI